MDCSALVSATADSLRKAGAEIEFLVCDRLFCELYSHQPRSTDSCKGAYERACVLLNKLAQAAPSFSITENPVKFEIENGISASQAPWGRLYAHNPNYPPPPTPNDSWLMGVEEEIGAKHWTAEIPPETRQRLRDLGAMQPDSELWPLINRLVCKEYSQEQVQGDSLTFFLSRAKECGWVVSGNFLPQPDWLCFGHTRVWRAYDYFVTIRHQGEAPAKKKSANLYFDMFHVACMAVCDGLLSADQVMLNMAWACWPQKRERLYALDNQTGDVILYKPTWRES